MSRFAELVSEGTIKDLEPIPNLTFTKEELKYLFNEGCIYEYNNQFIAVIPEKF